MKHPRVLGVDDRELYVLSRKPVKAQSPRRATKPKLRRPVRKP